MDTYEEKKSTEKKVKKIRTEKLRRAKISKARKGKGRKKRVGRPRRRKKKDKYIPNVVGSKAKQSKDGNVYVISAKRGPYKRTETRPKNVRGTWNPSAPVGGWTGWTSDAVNQAKLERRMDGFLPNRREQESNRIAKTNANKLKELQDTRDNERREIQGLGAEVATLQAQLQRNHDRMVDDRRRADIEKRRGRRGASADSGISFASDLPAGADAQSYMKPMSSVFTRVSPPTKRSPARSHYSGASDSLSSVSKRSLPDEAYEIGSRIPLPQPEPELRREEAQASKDDAATELAGDAARRRNKAGPYAVSKAYVKMREFNRRDGKNVWGVAPIEEGDMRGKHYVDKLPNPGGTKKNPGWNKTEKNAWDLYDARQRATAAATRPTALSEIMSEAGGEGEGEYYEP